MSKRKTNPSQYYKIFVISFLVAAFFLYDQIYIVVDEYFMDVPSCNVSESLLEDKSSANAGCLIMQNEKTLLVRDYNNHTYSIPAGTSNKIESAACTAHRETFEESGINVQVVKKLYVTDNGFNIFLCEPISVIDFNYQKKYEIDEVVFKKISDIENYKYPNQLNLIKRYLSKH